MTSTGADAVSDVITKAPGRRAIPLVRIGIGVAAIVALVLIGREAGGYVPRFAQWVDGLGPWGPAAFVVGYAVAVVAFVPGSVLTLAAGAIFVIDGRLRRLSLPRARRRCSQDRGRSTLSRDRPSHRTTRASNRPPAPPLADLPVQPVELRARAHAGAPRGLRGGVPRDASGDAPVRVLGQGCGRAGDARG